ncbi:MAG: hypothetical protein OXH57_07275 [Ekhidna sp.]|nr:hypothetical protein [Ekhidna sp.]
MDFPRVPYTKGMDTFWRLVKLGREVRQTTYLKARP